MSTNIYIQNKYAKLYFRIIENAKSQNRKCYTENHHIEPKCFGGSDNAKEHYVVHHLLTKMTTGKKKIQMMYAFNCFVFGLGFARDKRKCEIKVTARQFDYQRRLLSEIAKANIGDKNGFFGKHHTEESKKKAVATRNSHPLGYHRGKSIFSSEKVKECTRIRMKKNNPMKNELVKQKKKENKAHELGFTSNAEFEEYVLNLRNEMSMTVAMITRVIGCDNGKIIDLLKLRGIM